MSEIATQPEQPSIIAELRSPKFIEQLSAALPPGLTPERFARITVTALLDDQARQRDPSKQLLACDRLSLYQAVIKCAQDGLVPDGRQAALVKRGDKVVYQPMVSGLRQIAADHGWSLRGGSVREHDEFDWQEEPPSMFHKIHAPGDRGELVYAYAVARNTKTGAREQRVMTREEVLKRMESATSKNVWQSWPDEMWQKTAVRDLFQELALAHEVPDLPIAEIIDHEELSTVSEDEPHPSELTANVETAAEVSGNGPQPAAPPVATDDEPGPAEAPNPPSEAPAVDIAAINVAAEVAAGFVPPNGKYASGGQYGPKTLQEILELGDDGAKWLRWALGKIDAPEDYRDSIRAYARVFAPVIYQEWAAKQELS